MITIRNPDREGRVSSLRDSLPACENRASHDLSGAISRYEHFYAHRDERARVAYTAPTLVFVNSGQGKALERCAGSWRETQMRTESLALFPAGYEHGCQPGAHSTFIALTLTTQCRADCLGEMDMSRCILDLPPLLGRHDAVLSHLVYAMNAVCTSDSDTCTRLTIERIGHAIIQRLLELGRRPEGCLQRPERHGVRGRIQKAIELIRDDPGADIGIDDLACLSALSASHFVRCFKMATGMSPAEYQRRARIEMACRLLKSEDMALQDIAAAVGFDSVQGLRKAYERVVGTPIRRRAQ